MAVKERLVLLFMVLFQMKKRARKCNGESEPVVEQRHVYSLPCKHARPRFETTFVYKYRPFQPEHENAAFVQMHGTFDEDKNCRACSGIFDFPRCEAWT
jgi:hypothetical protein